MFASKVNLPILSVFIFKVVFILEVALSLSNSSPSSTVQSKSDKELTLFSPSHNNNKKNKNNKKNRKNPHKNQPERSVLQT